MPTKTASQKVECLNPNTGGKMNIDKKIYDLFSKAVYHTLEKSQPLTYSQIVEGIHDCFKQQKTKFDGSVEWYKEKWSSCMASHKFCVKPVRLDCCFF